MKMVSYLMQQSPASRQHIPPSCPEVVGVPRVGNIAGVVGVVHQEVQLAVRIAAADALHIPQVRAVHADQQIVLLVIGIGELPCYVTVAGYSVFRQLALRRRIDRIADLFPASCR